MLLLAQVLRQATHPSSSAITLGASQATPALHPCLWFPALAGKLPIEDAGSTSFEDSAYSSARLLWRAGLPGGALPGLGRRPGCSDQAALL